MKYFILILSVFLSVLAISCNDSSNNGKTEGNLGKEGYNCKKDKTCNDGLVCNRNNICEKDNVDGKVGTINNPCRADKSCNDDLVCNADNICEKKVDEQAGEEGHACKENAVCNGDLVCNLQNICEKQTDDHAGEEGKACKADKTCNYDLFCNIDNICEKNDVADFGKEGKPCIKVGDKKCLTDDLFCNEYDLCEKLQGNRGEEGSPCNIDGSCNAGLMCALEDICMNETDFNTGDENQDCRVTDDSMEFCYDGLTCGTYGNCELDCSPGNDSLCDNGEFNYSPYAGTYKLVRFDETDSCGSNNYAPKQDVGYEYFQLTFENDFGYKRLNYHSCENIGTCSYSKSNYKITPDGVEIATQNSDSSCTYTAIDTYIRMVGNKVRIRYTFNDAIVENDTECSSLNVHEHYGDMSCTKIRIIDGIKQ